MINFQNISGLFRRQRNARIGLLLAAMALGACQQASDSKTITITNPIDLNRRAETIAIPAAEIKALAEAFGMDNILVTDTQTGKVLVSQAIDTNADGTMDEILFQTDIPARGEKTFEIAGDKEAAARRPKSPVTTYSRFVPERTDDYTWENDRVAFRTYGPVAQQMVENKVAGGTLTSGMDAWLKRVDYPVIDSWYKKNQAEAGYYRIATIPTTWVPAGELGAWGCGTGIPCMCPKTLAATRSWPRGPSGPCLNLPMRPGRPMAAP